MRRLCLSAAVGPLLFALGCSRNLQTEAKSDPAAPVAPVAKVATADLSRQVALTAEFRPFQEIDVHAKVAGYLKKIYVDVGDRVKQGQLLGMLEVPELNAEVDQAGAAESSSQLQILRAESELKQAEAAHEDAHITYARL